ncbi:MAG: NAD(P)H-binding protein, partial [Spirochaetota bacterium]
MTVAVFGATGFVGSSLVKKLVDRGHRVRMISRTSPTGGLSAGVTHRTADIGNANQVSEAVGDADVAV